MKETKKPRKKALKAVRDPDFGNYRIEGDCDNGISKHYIKSLRFESGREARDYIGILRTQERQYETMKRF